MSTNTFGVCECGLRLSYDEAFEYLCKLQRLNKEDYSHMEQMDVISDYDGFVMLFNFSGSIAKFTDMGSLDYNSIVDYEDEQEVILLPAHSPKLFFASYADKNDLIKQLNVLYGNYLPDGFDIFEHLCYVFGSVYS